MSGLLDNFNRADAANLGANWTNINALASTRIPIVSNLADPPNSGLLAEAWIAATYGTNQEAGITIAGWSKSAHMWLFLQVTSATLSSAPFTGYLMDIFPTSVGASTVDTVLYRVNAGSSTAVKTVTSVSIGHGGTGVGDTWLIRKVGAVLTLLLNGVAVAGYPVTDSAPLTASGTYIGFGANGSATADLYDDFSGGDTATTYFGVSSVDLTDTVTTVGKRTTFGSSTVALVDTVTTAGKRTTFGSSTVTLTDTITTSAHRTTHGSSSTLLTVNITTVAQGAAAPVSPEPGTLARTGRGRIDQTDRGRFAHTEVS